MEMSQKTNDDRSDLSNAKPTQKKFMSAMEAKKNAKVLRKTKEKPEVTVDMLLSPAGLTQLAENIEKLHANMNYGKDTEVLTICFPIFSSTSSTT
jgi:hypothetical protein